MHHSLPKIGLVQLQYLSIHLFAWVGGWLNVKAVLRITYSNKTFTSIF